MEKSRSIGNHFSCWKIEKYVFNFWGWQEWRGKSLACSFTDVYTLSLITRAWQEQTLQNETRRKSFVFCALKYQKVMKIYHAIMTNVSWLIENKRKSRSCQGKSLQGEVLLQHLVDTFAISKVIMKYSRHNGKWKRKKDDGAMVMVISSHNHSNAAAWFVPTRWLFRSASFFLYSGAWNWIAIFHFRHFVASVKSSI